MCVGDTTVAVRNRSTLIVNAVIPFGDCSSSVVPTASFDYDHCYGHLLSRSNAYIIIRLSAAVSII